MSGAHAPDSSGSVGDKPPTKENDMVENVHHENGKPILPIFDKLQEKIIPLIKANYKMKKLFHFQISPPQGAEELSRRELIELAKQENLKGKLKIKKINKKKEIFYWLFTTIDYEERTINYKLNAWYLKKIIREKKSRSAARGVSENYQRAFRPFNGEKLARINIYELPLIFDKKIITEIANYLGEIRFIKYPLESDISFGTVTLYFKKIYRDIDGGKYIKISNKETIKYVIQNMSMKMKMNFILIEQKIR